MLDNIAEKYWKGECSLSEEQQLKDALLTGEVPEGHEELADYLRFLEAEKTSMQLDESFDRAIMEQIKARARRRIFPAYAVRIAASLVLLVGIGLSIQSMYEAPVVAADTEFVDTFQDSEEAYREVRKALMLVSSKMNNGLEPAGKLSEFHRAKEEITNN